MEIKRGRATGAASFNDDTNGGNPLKKKLLLLGTLFTIAVQLLAGAAWADVAFSTSDYTNGTIGTVGSTSAITGDRATNFGGDTVVFPFAAGDRLLAADRSSAGTADDSVYIYDPADLSKPLKNTTWPGARNVYGVEQVGYYLYVVCYTNGNVLKIDTRDFTKTAEYKFDNSVLPAGYTAKGVSIAQLGGTLYALFMVSDTGYPPSYQQSRLVKLSTDLMQLASMQLPENAHTVTTSKGQLYVASWGGVQDNKADASKSKLLAINTAVMGEAEVFNGSDIDGGQIAAIRFAPDGTALIATHRYDANFNTTARIYRLDSGLVASDKKLLKTLDGWSTTIVYDGVTGYFWISNANGQNGPDQLLAFDRSTGNLVKNFSAADLGGPAYFVAPVYRSSATPPGSFSITPTNMALATGETKNVLVTGGTVTWTVANAAIAKVEPTSTTGFYHVTGLAEGTTTMTATLDSDPTQTATLTVAVSASGGGSSGGSGGGGCSTGTLGAMGLLLISTFFATRRR